MENNFKEQKMGGKIKKSVLNKKSVKLISIFLLFVAGAVFLWCFSYYLSPEAKEDREARKFLDEQREMYENDTYGGATPEETLSLFIEALEEGDVELASKYFVFDKQKDMKKELRKLKEEYGLDLLEDDAEKLNLSKKTNDKAFYTIVDDKNRVRVQVVLYKNSKDQWKISEL